MFGRIPLRPTQEAFYVTEAGLRFRAILFPASRTALPAASFLNPRRFLRVRPGEPVGPGMVFQDDEQRWFLIAHHDGPNYAAIQMTDRVSWSRIAPGPLHPVTHQPTAASAQTLGPIWAAIESLSDLTEAGLPVTIQRQRIITGAPIRLGDRVNDQTVKQVTQTLGIFVGDIA